MKSCCLSCVQQPAIFTGSEVRIRDPDLPLLNLAVAFKGASWTDPDAVPLMVMQTLLGAYDKNTGAGKQTAGLLSARKLTIPIPAMAV